MVETDRALLDAIRRLAVSPSSSFLPLFYDSDEERDLFVRLQTLCEQETLPWTMVPQIELASLSPVLDPRNAERGDLLLVHPERRPILVEVDGEHHRDHRARDQERDRALEKAGVPVLRVPAREIRSGSGLNFEGLFAEMREGHVDRLDENALSIILRWCKLLHQVQLTLLMALRGGWLRIDASWRIGVVLPALLRDDPRGRTLVRVVISDFLELLRRLGHLYGRSPQLVEPQVVLVDHGETAAVFDVLIGPSDGRGDHLAAGIAARFLISDVLLPFEIQAPLTAAVPVRLSAPDCDDARWFLRYLFRKDNFWEGQWETIQRSLRGQDSVVLLPTGAGKSIAFQLAALMLPGRCIVVDPIISLIDDQIDNLARVGIDRCIGITSELSTDEREQALRAFKAGHFLFCYVAPERFQTIPFREALRALATSSPISLIAVDEAHCVSEWGHDFRTAYLNLGRITRDYCASQDVVPPLVALTGTASKIVLKDVQRELGVTAFDAIITPKTFDRPELRYSIWSCPSSEKTQRVEGFLSRLPTDFAIDRSGFFRPSGSQTQAGLVFCPHVNGSYGVVEQAENLARVLGTRIDAYSGTAPHGANEEQWRERKSRIARDFKRNQTAVLVCTKAFGMGIDKPNIRYTVHIGLPASIESFYQEAGRAGRDRERAECAVILSNDNPVRSQRVLSPATPIEEIARIVDSTEWSDSDDIIRALFFHVRAFRGESAEVQDVTTMIDALGNLESRRQVNTTWRDQRWSSGDTGSDPKKRSDQAKKRAEKALHRLVVLGVVADYTIAAQEFNVKISGATPDEIAASFGRYASSYQRRLGEEAERKVLGFPRQPHRSYVRGVAKELIKFIYEHIELARRRALNEMLQAASSARTGEDLRRRILEYLEQSEWDERLEEVRNSDRGGVNVLGLLLDDLASPSDAATLRGAVARALQSYPDVPGLLILRAVTEALSSDMNPEVVSQNVDAALRFADETFRLNRTEIAAALGQVATHVFDKGKSAELLIASSLGSAFVDRSFVRELILYMPQELAAIPARWLNDQLAERCVSLRTHGGK